jgi:hypothetical protein
MAAACFANRSFGLFGDEVFTAGDLNRRSSEVLNRASQNPVTISRNGERFALLRRDQAAELVRASNQFGPIVELVAAALSIVEKKEPPVSLSWLKAFDIDNLRKMIREVLVACGSALRETGDWEAVDIIVHQWHESALVAMSGVLVEAMNSPAEESLLIDPRSIVEAETAETEVASATGSAT